MTSNETDVAMPPPGVVPSADALPPAAWALLNSWSSAWDAPVTSKRALERGAVQPLLKLAARAVAKVQPHFTPATDVPPFGRSRELLLQTIHGEATTLADPKRDPAAFVRELVEAAFQTGDGELAAGIDGDAFTRLVSEVCAGELADAQQLRDGNPVDVIAEAIQEASKAAEALKARPLGEGDIAGVAARLEVAQRIRRLAAEMAELASAPASAEVVDCDLGHEGAMEGKDAGSVDGMEVDAAAGVGEDASPGGSKSCPEEEAEEEPLNRTKSQVLKQLKVVKVSEKVDGHSDPIHDLSRSVSILAKKEVPEGQAGALREALATVEKAHKSARNYGEDLLEDLLALDDLSGLAPEDKTLRKEAIGNIESLLGEVDSAKSKLGGLRKKLEQEFEKVKPPETDPPAPEPTPAPKAAPKPSLSPRKGLTPPSREAWSQLRLPLEFHSKETQRGYLILATITGLSTDDIKLTLNKDDTELTVEGVRVPSDREVKQMTQRLRAQLSGRMSARSADAFLEDPRQQEQAFFEMGQARFGRFSETFRVPENADANRSSASYEDGVLRVEIPYVPRQQAPLAGHGSGYAPHGMYRGRRPLPGSRSARAPRQAPAGHPGLFGGRDQDFYW